MRRAGDCLEERRDSNLVCYRALRVGPFHEDVVPDMRETYSMRCTKMMALCALVSVPLLTGGTSAKAANNDYAGQAQRFLNNNNNSDDRSGYERGRDDEMRRQQAQGERHDYRRDDY